MCEVLEAGTEVLAYGLMSQTYAEYGFRKGKTLQHLGHFARLGGYARPGRKDYLVAGGHAPHVDVVVAHDVDTSSRCLHGMAEVVSEGVVIVYNGYFHLLAVLFVCQIFSAISMARRSAASLLFTSCSSAMRSLRATMPPPA